jgi:hypothetical protein
LAKKVTDGDVGILEVTLKDVLDSNNGFMAESNEAWSCTVPGDPQGKEACTERIDVVSVPVYRIGVLEKRMAIVLLRSTTFADVSTVPAHSEAHDVAVKLIAARKCKCVKFEGQ